MFKKIRNIHFVGIGGSGMSGIAEVLLTLGYNVSGSDLKASDTTDRLGKLGAKVFWGHKAVHAKGAHVLVTSTAVKPDNPEVREALRGNVPVIPRIEMLAELARLKYTIAVAGTHGKTTTTSMISWVLQAGTLDPTVVVGGRMHNMGTGARVGKGDYLVAEADESDGSFLKLSPTLAVITNIDDDHLDYWGNMDALFKGFESFANKTPFYGTVFLGLDDKGSRNLQPRIRRTVKTYGLCAEADVSAQNIQMISGKTCFSVVSHGKNLGQIKWPVPGTHNLMNALAAAAVGLELNIPFKTIAKALASFKGVGRRLDVKGENNGVLVLDDYGHHPTEIKATLQAVKSQWPHRRCVVLFQPHRYTRTKILANEFKTCFQKADAFFLLDIYPAGEKPLPGITSDWLANQMGTAQKPVIRLPAHNGLSSLVNFVNPGDVVLTLGAGDVWKWGEKLLKSVGAGPCARPIKSKKNQKMKSLPGRSL